MKIQLSISLLASDRAASLERCLDSLRPLLMQVPSELIVVFTGTDERVREIAGRYTDKILPFTWCDNFSAARNVGLWAAKGEWFMYIDDDEWFEDVTEIRDFFLSGEYRNWGCGLYKQKNFTDWDGVRYSDFHAFRMARIIPGMAFQNTVHEEMVPRPEPCKYFDAYVNHYGYISDTGRLSVEKSNRNLPLLLKNIAERPRYIKNYLQIVQEYIIGGELEKAEEYCREGRRLCSGQQDKFYKGWLQVNLLNILYEKKDYKKVEQEALTMLEKENPWEITRLDIYASLIAVYTKRGESGEVTRYGKKYEELLNYMDQRPELWAQQSYAEITEGSIKIPSKMYQIRLSCTESALKLGETEQAVYFLGLLPWDEENWMQQYYPVFDNWKENHPEHFRKLLEHFPQHSPYRLLQRAVGDDGMYTEEERQKAFIQCMEGTGSVYMQHQAVKEAILNQMDLTDIVNKLNLDAWKQNAGNVKELIPPEETWKLEEAAEKLLRDAPAYGLWLKKLLCEKELIRGYLMGDVLIQALEEYTGYILRFYQIQYRDEMFHMTKQNLLPQDCRFALYVSEALEKIERAEYPEAVRLFRKALQFYPKMTSVIREVITIDAGTYEATLAFFDAQLRLLHPFMPFITEELWQHLSERAAGESIMLARLPEAGAVDDKLIADMDIIKEIVAGVRTIRKQKQIPGREPLELLVLGTWPGHLNAVLEKMAGLSAIRAVEEKQAGAATFRVQATEFAVPLQGNVNVEEERAKIEADLKHLRGFLAGVEKKLSNERFVSSAPEAVVALERKKQADALEKITALEASLKALG